MKKVIALVLALTMVFALCACGKTASDTPAADSSGPAPASEPIKVRIASSAMSTPRALLFRSSRNCLRNVATELSPLSFTPTTNSAQPRSGRT